MKNRQLIALSVAAACAAPIAQAAQNDPAAAFPARPIRVIVPFTPGGQPDIFSRMIGQKAGEALGQQVVVDNRPGAGGMIGCKTVADASPDGYTLLSNSSSHTILPSARKLPYDVRKDFIGISTTYKAAYLLVVPPSLGVKTAQDLVALAKSKPGQLNFGSAGTGSGTHFAAEMFKHAAGINIVHVPYKGIPEAMNDLMAGRVQIFMAPLGSSTQLVKDGRMRAVGITSIKRSSVLPDIPTLDEAGLKGFRWDSWGALFAPARTPAAIIAKLNRAVTAALRQPDVEKNMRALAVEPAPSTPAEVDRFVAQDLVQVQKLANLAGIKPE